MESLAYQSELGNFGISLHGRIIDVLISEVEKAIADGRIRSQDGKHSVFDFIEEILGKKNPRQVFTDLIELDEVVQKMDNLKFEGSGQRKTPVTDMTGLIYLTYLANCDYSRKFRSASAAYFAADRMKSQIPTTSEVVTDRHNLPAPIPFQPETPDEKPAHLRSRISELKTEVAARDSKIADLEAVLSDWADKYRQVYNKMQYHQARAMGAEMLDRLMTRPDEFSEFSDLLWQIAGTHDKYYFVSRCKQDLEYGVDYVFGKGKGQLKLTPHAALQMMLSLRSRKGVQVRYLPEKAELNVHKIVGNSDSKINRRQLQSRD